MNEVQTADQMTIDEAARVEEMTWGQFTEDRFFRIYISRDDTRVIEVVSDDGKTVTYKEKSKGSGATHQVPTAAFRSMLNAGGFRPVTPLSSKLDKYLIKDAKYKHWTDIYDHEFNRLITQFWPDGVKIAAEAKKLYEKHRGDPLWDEAYRRWIGN